MDAVYVCGILVNAGRLILVLQWVLKKPEP